jgi:hypothetical protein
VSYPQPSADQYAIKGYQYFRLDTPLTSPGDIYESQQSGHGLAVGPNSDIANVNVAYFDDQIANTFMNTTVISPNRAFVGRVDARNEVAYGPTGRPGVILFWANDIYDPNYRPFSKPAKFDPAQDEIQFVPPQLDVIEYFKPIESLGPARIDKEFNFQNYSVTTRTFFLVIPYYGRKYCYIEFTNKDTVVPNTFGIVGLNYAITQDDSANPYHQETTIRAPAAVAAQATVTRIITASGDPATGNGMFDALVFSFSGAGPAPLRIVMSDTGGA